MCALANTTRIGIINEHFIKIWIQNSTNCVVQYSISYTGLMNIPWLGIIDFKSVIRAMLICFFFEFPMENQYIISQIESKLLNILAFSFATQKLSPRCE